MGAGLHRIRIVLVEPAGPLNIGSTARVMKNMGLRNLVLVNPHCDPLGDEARQMAVHAADVLEAARQVETLSQALKGCFRAIATTARPRDAAPAVPLESPRSALPWLLEMPSALIFGPEDRGLSNAELNYAQRFITIPSSSDYPSLNLAQAVAVCCYELYQSVQSPAAASPPPLLAPAEADLAPLDAIERYVTHLSSVLLEIGYLYPHTAPSRMQKFRQMALRSQLSSSELALLRGILRQVEWATHQKTPAELEKTD
ncbi:RNA methyltransferase [Altericista sp. CCNU0014]|uniref:RNA methyltransferase n=1 Tax=Altericista sp. CCNU0014 TaxID=3082949 RepID=UPI00384A57D6